MCKNLCIMTTILLLAAGTGSAQSMGQAFSLLPTFDTEIGNDEGLPPDASSNGTGMGIRNVATRRRVAYVTYDLSGMGASGMTFSQVSFSNYGHDSGTINVYGVLEEYEYLVADGLTWNTAPGVANDPVPALDSEVALDPEDLTDILLTFSAPARGVRASTDTSDALAAFLNSDTNGFVAFLFAPDEAGNAILRTVEMGEDGGSRLEGVLARGVQAYNESPRNDAVDVFRDTDFAWSPGSYDGRHDVYLGTLYDDVNDADRDSHANVVLSQNLNLAEFDPGRLDMDQTYYWRVDEVNTADGAIAKGQVWHFTVEPPSYLIAAEKIDVSASSRSEEAQRTIDGSGLAEGLHDSNPANMWLSAADDPAPWLLYAFDRPRQLDKILIWNLNQSPNGGVKDAIIETSLDGTAWTAPPGAIQMPAAPGTDNYGPGQTITLGAVTANFVRISLVSTWDGDASQNGLSEVQFYDIPLMARIPQPVDAGTNIDPTAPLAWRPGRQADQHMVYIDTDPNALANGTAPMVRVDNRQIDGTALGLQLNQTYYWRVDEVNDAEVPAVWEGDVWSFSTFESFNVDNFESYSNEAKTLQRPFQTWIDGWGYTNPEPGQAGNGTGATVGHDIFSADSPYYEGLLMETVSVNSGSQSLPLYYDNTGADGKATYSQIDRTWSESQNWDQSGVNTLALHVRGNPQAFEEDAEGRMIISASGADIFGAADEFRFVYKEISGNGAIIARVNSLEAVDDWSLAGVMIRQRLTDNTRFAGVFMTAANGVRMRTRAQVGGDADSDTDDADGNPIATDEQKAVQAPAWIKLERSGTFNFSGYYATTEEMPTEADWTPLAWNAQRVTMAGSLYIGLAVCSHASGKYTIAQFSDVQTEGNVTGDWQVESIGLVQPENSTEPFYVLLTDGGQHLGKAVCPDAGIVLSPDWTRWDIPIDVFTSAGVDMADIQSMSIGIGQPERAAAGGSGMLLIDDIQLRKAE